MCFKQEGPNFYNIAQGSLAWHRGHHPWVKIGGVVAQLIILLCLSIYIKGIPSRVYLRIHFK